MYSVEEVAKELNVSKVTVYAKLKKFDNMVVLKQNKKYVTEDLLILIKKDLKVKDIEKESVNDEIATDREDLINLNKELISTLIEQLKVKDKQIEELNKLIENSQVLLKEKKVQDPLLIQERIENFDIKLEQIKEKMDQRKEEKRGFWDRFKKQ